MTAEPVLDVRDLSVTFEQTAAVDGVSFVLARGETAALVGESGSGKTVAMLAALGLLPPGAQAGGAVMFEGANLIGMPRRQLDGIRGRRIAIIFQEPMSSLDPLFSIGAQIGAVLRLRGGLSRRAARERTIALLDLVGIPAPERRLHAYPHELSGGQRQRVAIAMAISCNPDILIADEPTTALDATVAGRILDLITDLKTKLGLALIFISHDLDLVARFADTIHVMQHGRIVESGTASTLMAAPQAAYTRKLIEAVPRRTRPPRGGVAPVLLDARDISVSFRTRAGLFARPHVIKAVDGVSLTLRKGETLGLIGDSGSGKSTLGRALLKLVPASGRVAFEDRDLTGLGRAALRPLRSAMQLVLQDPYGSLSPRMNVGDIVTEGLRVHEPGLTRAMRDARAAAAFEEVRLDPALRHRRPNAFSGGQRQRIAIARAMILKPKLVVLDEPTSALDRSVQMDILALLTHLQETHGLSYVFISHDLAVIRAMADEIVVMRDGRVMERR